LIVSRFFFLPSSSNHAFSVLFRWFTHCIDSAVMPAIKEAVRRVLKIIPPSSHLVDTEVRLASHGPSDAVCFAIRFSLV
jgi:hypothetical protein